MSACGIVAQEIDPRKFEGKLLGFLGPKREQELHEFFRRMVEDGVDEFIISIDGGYALMIAGTLLMWKISENADVKLSCMLLWEEQHADWPEPVRNVFFALMALCDREIMLERHRSDDNLDRRDRFLAEHCRHLLAVWDGGAGPVWRTVALARQRGLTVWEQPLKG